MPKHILACSRLLTLLLRYSIFARNHNVLSDLLLEAKKAYYAAEEHLISIYVSEVCVVRAYFT